MNSDRLLNDNDDMLQQQNRHQCVQQQYQEKPDVNTAVAAPAIPTTATAETATATTASISATTTDSSPTRQHLSSSTKSTFSSD